MKRYLFVIWALFFSFTAGIANTIPSQPNKRPPTLKGIILFGDHRTPPSETELLMTKGIKIVDIKIPGNRKTLTSRLKSTYLNQPLTEQQVKEIKNEIAQYYRDQGYPFILIEVPEQDVTFGVLQLIIIESKLDTLSVTGARWTSTKRLKHYFSMKAGKTLDENKILRALNFVNRNPFRRVDVIYGPGSQGGTTDVTLFVKDRRPFRFYAGTDNTGFPAIGRTRVFAGFNWGNAFNLDHILSYQYTVSTHLNRFQAHTLQYLAPLPWQHLLNVYGGYAHVDAHFPFPQKKHSGFALQGSLRYDIPLKLSRYLRHDFLFGFDFKRLNNTEEFNAFTSIFARIVNLTQAVVGYIGNYTRNSFRMDFDGEIFFSPVEWLADQSNHDFRSVSPGAKNKWVYGKADFTYLQKLPRSLFFNFMLRGQASSSNLLPSEQLGVGGHDTVRGYEEREINKDNGLIANAELRIPTPVHFFNQKKTKDTFQAVLFVDYGFGTNHKNLPVLPKYQWLLGAGPGIRYTIDSCLTARVDYGVKLHHSRFFTDQHSFVYFSVVGSY